MSNIKLIIGVVVVIVLIVGVLILNPFTTIKSQEVGILTEFGKITGTVGEGLHLINPITTEVVKMQISTQKESMPASAASKDLQSVNTEITINYRIDPNKAADVFREMRTDYSTTIVQPSIQEAVKNATAKYTAEELLTKREEVKGQIFEDLKNRLGSRNIIVIEALITNFDFSASFNAAVEAKVTAEQNAFKAERDLDRVKFEAQQAIEKAKAEAESIRIQAEAVTSQGGADYVKLKAIEKWNGDVPTHMIPGSAVPFIEIN